MKTSRILTTLILCLLPLSSWAACERESLRSTVDNYLAALSANDASSLSFSDDLKYTENGVVMQTGGGFFETAGEVTFTRSALDTESCGTVTMGLIKENDRDIIVGIRLKLNDDQEISEIEHIIAREQEFAFRPEGVLLPEFINWEAPLPVEHRSSRAAMVAAANDYFDMFVGEPEVSAPFSSTCHRWENGTHTTRAGNCSPKGLTIIHPHRRVPVVDRETGIAVAFIHFAGSLPDLHMFKFRHGRIEFAQAVIGPAAADIGWPDDTSLSRRSPPQGEQMSQALNATEEGEN